MPRPNIATITPNTGVTGGRRLVEITGSNFQLPPAPAAFGVTTPPNPSVEVLFGSSLAPTVHVVSEARLLVVTPIHDPGPVNVTVRNIDQAGAVVGTETTTATNAFTYARPNLDAKSDLTRVVEALIVELRRQVLDNVQLTVHTDYDDAPDGANVAMLSTVPGLVLSGPDLRRNRFFSLNQKRSVDMGGGIFRQLRPPRTVDVGFTIIGVSESKVQIVNLMSEVTAFFERNAYLTMARDVAAPNGERVQYEMEVDSDGDMKVNRSGGAANSNLRSFTGSFTIRGVDIDDADMAIEETAVLQDQQAEESVGLPSPVVLDNQQAAQPPAAIGGGVIQFGPGFPPGPSHGDE